MKGRRTFDECGSTVKDVGPVLIGRRITGFRLSDDRETLVLDTATGPVTLHAWGDCCSRTWIEGLDDPDALLGTVSAVEDVELSDEWKRAFPRDDDAAYFYGLKITTDQGRCLIDYRNDNTYYGGGIEVIQA